PLAGCREAQASRGGRPAGPQAARRGVMRAWGVLVLVGLALAVPALASAQSARQLEAGHQAQQRGDLDTAIAEYTRAIDAGDLSRDDRAIALSNRGAAFMGK